MIIQQNMAQPQVDSENGASASLNFFFFIAFLFITTPDIFLYIGVFHIPSIILYMYIYSSS